MKSVKNQKMRMRKSEFLSLERAVNEFNKKIDKLEKRGITENIPERADFQAIKQSIYTKNELNRYVRELRLFLEKGQEKTVKLESGLEMTLWEKTVISKRAAIRTKTLKAQLKEYTIPNAQGLTLAQMGNTEARRLQANLERIQEFPKMAADKLKSLKSYLMQTGTLDYEARKAAIYRKNYMETIEKQFSKLDGYKELKKLFNSTKDPIEFFEMIKNTGDINIIDIHYASNQTMTQEQFNSYLQKLGIEIEEG